MRGAKKHRAGDRPRVGENHEDEAGRLVAQKADPENGLGRENEEEAYGNMLRQFPDGLVAVVSDSYDIYRACTELWGKKLRRQVLERNGTLVVRPDSGKPQEVVVKVLEALGSAFGAEKNAKGYLVLNPKVRVIQGDGIELGTLDSILFTMKLAGWSADNIAFGSGGGLLQKVNRDTSKFAFKCSAVEVDGEWRDALLMELLADELAR